MDKKFFILLFSFLISNSLELYNQDIGNKLTKSSMNSIDINNSTILEETISPKTYIVGPGDVISFNMISTDGMYIQDLVISPLGSVLIPNVGNIYIDKLILFEAFDKIKKECLSTYSNAKVNLTLKSIREFKIQVVGVIDNPGFIIVNPLTRVSDVYSKAKNNEVNISSIIDEFNSNSNISLRNIILVRDEEEINVDLLKYYYGGDKSFNPLVQQGDIIKFSSKKNEVKIRGGIPLPGLYETVSDESVYELINLLGGFNSNADTNFVEVSRFISEKENKQYILKNSNEMHDFKIEPFDYINVRYKNNFKTRDIISIDGEVNFPGEYDLYSNKVSIRTILDVAGGYTDKADINKILVNNEIIISNEDLEYKRIMLIDDKDRTASEVSYVKSRNKIKKGLMLSEDYDRTQEILSYIVQPGDLIFIPKKTNYIEIIGSVKFPGRYPYNNSFDVSDYIESAGGKTSNSTRKIYIIDNASNQKNRVKNKDKLNNGDILFIESKEDFSPYNRFKEAMIIIGQAASLYAVIMLNK